MHALRPGRAYSRPEHGSLAAAARKHGCDCRLALRAARAGRLSQYGRRLRCRRLACWASIARCTFRTIPLYYEKFYFTPGDLGFRAFDTRYGTIGVLVCWDQWYPEGARLTALQGARFCSIRRPSAGTRAEKAEYGAAQHDAWETMQRAHAIANGVFVAAVNRVGHEGPADGGLEFWGSSFVSDPFGVVLRKRPTGGRDPGRGMRSRQLESVRRNWPFLRDRRIDSYGQIVNRLIDGTE